MSPDEAYGVLESSQLEMGMNYLIADGNVHGVMVWVQGGIAYRETWTPADPGFESRYRSAANNPHTLFAPREENSHER